MEINKGKQLHSHGHATVNVYTQRCGYEVPGMILLFHLKGAMWRDRSEDTNVHVSTCTSCNLKAWTPVVWELCR